MPTRARPRTRLIARSEGAACRSRVSKRRSNRVFALWTRSRVLVCIPDRDESTRVYISYDKILIPPSYCTYPEAGTHTGVPIVRGGPVRRVRSRASKIRRQRWCEESPGRISDVQTRDPPLPPSTHPLTHPHTHTRTHAAALQAHPPHATQDSLSHVGGIAIWERPFSNASTCLSTQLSAET